MGNILQAISVNADLPDDVIREILLRLPVKSLSKFKCVCKDWYTLIESQSFVNEHFVNKSNPERLILFEHGNDTLIFADESSSELYHLTMSGNFFNIMGPVNGVFCVNSDSRGMGLLNPAMRQFKRLPSLSPDHPYYGFLGFGFDPLSGYYKVVSIQVQADSNPVVHIYNSGSGSWRLIENVDMLRSVQCALSSKLSTYLNGVSYWIIQYRDNGFDVLAFNMSSDEFQIIHLPNAIRGGVHRLVLVVYGDSIAILSYNIPLHHVSSFIDMWILKNDGRWAKISTFGPFSNLRSPLGFWKNNELMLEVSTNSGSVWTLYNISTHELRRDEAKGMMIFSSGYFAHFPYTYKESLVSIKKEGDYCISGDIFSSRFNDGSLQGQLTSLDGWTDKKD